MGKVVVGAIVHFPTFKHTMVRRRKNAISENVTIMGCIAWWNFPTFEHTMMRRRKNAIAENVTLMGYIAW